MKLQIMAVGLAMASLAILGSAAAGEIDWSKYMKRSNAVSAIASAMSSVESCSVPLEFEEIVKDDLILLKINCRGTEDEEGAAIIEFKDFGDGILSPERFLYIG